LKGYLLDTNALLWLESRPLSLRPSTHDALLQGPLFVSVVSIAEIAIKAAIGKLPLPPPFETDFQLAVRRMLEDSAIDLLPLDLPVVSRLWRLPQYHRDPFDRMIIAQALESGLTVATRDRAFFAYAGLDILEV
jgi:PIN domain nuclease of toxin-antitoxin system